VRSASGRAASWSANVASMIRAHCWRMPVSDTSFVRMSAEVTEDAVLGGKLRLKQPTGGHRFGHDAILLAAACPARAGERVVDLGAGGGPAGPGPAPRGGRPQPLAGGNRAPPPPPSPGKAQPNRARAPGGAVGLYV